MPKVLRYIVTPMAPPFTRSDAVSPAEAAANVYAHKLRLEQGNMSNVATVGKGVFEKTIDWGPGYRIYFGQDGKELIILLGGSSKKGQQAEIEAAHGRWQDYKKRKKQEK